MNWTRETIAEGLKRDYWEALRQLYYKGWGRDGALIGANLQGWDTVLDEADLSDAQVRGLSLLDGSACRTRFVRADLRECFIVNSPLTHAVFDGANLQRAVIVLCDMQGASLVGADLRQAHLAFLSLVGANLTGATLIRPSFEHVTFDETTILPDGTPWTATTDWTRFTYPPTSD